MLFTFAVEARGYGDPVGEGEALMAAYDEAAGDMKPNVAVDDRRGLIMATVQVDAADAVDAHDEGFALWRETWEATFPDASGPPSRIAVACFPAGEPRRIELVDEEVGAGGA